MMQTKSQRKGTRRTGCLGKLILSVILILVVLGITGAIYQVYAESSDRRNFPPPGELVDVGGFRLHLYCTGTTQAGSPTVILETLSGGMSPYWVWVQTELEKTTRVCSYDRPGRAWSDPSPSALTLSGTVQNLHTLLQAGGEPGPYVMVGHSIGGLFVRAYHAQYPQEVRALVLLDSSYPHQYELHPEWLSQNEAFNRIQAFFPFVARIGLFHFYFSTGGEMDFKDLPEPQHSQVAAFLSSPRYYNTMQNKLTASPAIFQHAQALGDLGDLPLAVISAGTGSLSGWSELQAELAKLSSNSVHTTIAEATHVSLAFNPQHARQVAGIILDQLKALP